MKKLFLALLVTVMSFALFAKINASAATSGYAWVDQYATDGKTVMLPHGAVWPDLNHYGYSGVDVLLGNYAVAIARGQVYVPNTAMDAPAGLNYASLAALYVNTSADQTWYIPRTVAPGYFMVLINENGQVYNIINSHIFFNDAQFDSTQAYNVWWEEGAMQKTGAADLAVKPNETVELTYGDLGTNYHWLTKADVDANKATGITFADTDKVYKDAAGKYTNVATGNTVVINDLKGYELDPGHKMLSIQYLDYVDYMANLKEFYKLVDGTDGKASIVEHDVTGPAIVGSKTALQQVEQGTAFTVPTVSGADTGKVTVVGDEETPAVTTELFKFNPETKAFDLSIAEIDTDTIGHYQVKWTSQDSLGNTTTVKMPVDVVEHFAPVFTGVANKTINMGDTFDPKAGVTVDDGYGYDKTAIVVNIGNFNKNIPGVYTIELNATNIWGVTKFATFTVTVLDTQKPTVFVPNPVVTVVKGTEFDLASKVFAVDNVPGALTLSVVDNEGYDKDTVGTYTVTVQVADAAGNKQNVTYVLEVVDKDVVTRVGDLEDGQADLQAALAAQVADLTSKLNEVKTSLQDSIDFVNTKLQQVQTDLQTNVDDLTDNTGSKDQNSLILTVVVGVVALAGVGAAGFALKRK